MAWIIRYDGSHRLQGLQASLDRHPPDTVLQANREPAAKVRVSKRLSGTRVGLTQL